KAVAEALVNELGLLRSDALDLVACLHGFDDWDALKDTVMVGFDPGVFDEDIEQDDLHERRTIQSEIAFSHGIDDMLIALAVIEMLAPTSRSGPTSLRGLEHELHTKERTIYG